MHLDNRCCSFTNTLTVPIRLYCSMADKVCGGRQGSRALQQTGPLQCAVLWPKPQHSHKLEQPCAQHSIHQPNTNTGLSLPNLAEQIELSKASYSKRSQACHNTAQHGAAQPT